MLAGVAPIPANSGQITTRYRLNRYGDRQLNNALHTVVQSRIQYQPATRDYVARRTPEGKTGREIKRCLARYVARDLYRLLEHSRGALTKHRSVAPPPRPMVEDHVRPPLGSRPAGACCQVWEDDRARGSAAG